MAVKAAMLRPNANIYAFAATPEVCRQLALARGIEANTIPFYDDPLHTINHAVDYMKENKMVEAGKPLIVVSDTLRKNKMVDSILLIYA